MPTTLTGVDEMIAMLRKVKIELPKLVAKALEEDTQKDVEECKRRSPVYVGPSGPGKPIPGVLRDSIHSEPVQITRDQISIEIVAGGEAGAYAIPQHEELTYQHEVGRSKYIESVLMEMRDEKLARVAALVDISEIKL
jgi:hypothetical protein